MPQLLNVTWIAPTVPGLEELAWLNELGSLQSIEGVTVRTLTGDNVSLPKVATVLRQSCDVIIWAGHGEAGGLYLSDRKLILPLWFAGQVSHGCRPRVVILAACSSQLRETITLKSLTETLCRKGINAIGFPSAAGDTAAGIFSVEYVRALVMGLSVVDAFDIAHEQIITNPATKETAEGVFFTPGVHDLPFNLEPTLDRIEALARSNARLLQMLTEHLVHPGGEPGVVGARGSEEPGAIQTLSHTVPPGKLRGIGKKQG